MLGSELFILHLLNLGMQFVDPISNHNVIPLQFQCAIYQVVGSHPCPNIGRQIFDLPDIDVKLVHRNGVEEDMKIKIISHNLLDRRRQRIGRERPVTDHFEVADGDFVRIPLAGADRAIDIDSPLCRCRRRYEAHDKHKH